MDGSDHKRDQGSHETNPDFGLDSDDVTRATASIVASAQVARTRIAAVQQLADCLLDQNLKYTRSLLEEYGVKSVGDQEGLRQLLVNALLSNQVPFHSAKELLHNVEPWPSHIYFFKAAPELCSQFDSFQKLKRMLSAKELVHLLNRDRTIEIPASMKIESIQFEDGVVRVYMISRRTWKMRDLSGDDVRTDRVLLCYKPCVARAASIFEIDTATGQAFLSIPQLQKKSSYSAEKDRLLRLLTSVFDISKLNRRPLAEAIKQAINDPSNVIRSVGIEANNKNRMTLRSGSKNQSVLDDPDFVAAKNCVRGGLIDDGNFYIPTQENPEEDFRCRMHPDHRMSFFSQIDESEVRHVIRTVQSTFE